MRVCLLPSLGKISTRSISSVERFLRGQGWAWSKRDLSGQRFVYIWADGIYSNVRLDDERQCLLVVMGALEDGRKQLLAVHDGFRESELSWQELLEDLKRQGLELPPKLAVGDGAMGFWAALRKVYPATGEQRCWLHKTANVLNKLPQSMQGKAKQALRDIYLAESRQTAEAALDRFKNLYEKKFPQAVECLEKDRQVLLAFYDFPAEHWGHLRTTNPIESTFATVRLRQRRTKGCGSREASLTMVFMLARQAERHWRRLNGSEVIVHVLEGKVKIDGRACQKEFTVKRVAHSGVYPSAKDPSGFEILQWGRIVQPVGDLLTKAIGKSLPSLRLRAISVHAKGVPHGLTRSFVGPQEFSPDALDDRIHRRGQVLVVKHALGKPLPRGAEVPNDGASG